MAQPTLNDALLVFRDMLGRRKPLILKLDVGRVYLKRIDAQVQAIEALPEALRGTVPLAQELGIADETHDGFGGGLHHQFESYQRAPRVAPEVREAAKRLRDTFIPSLSDLQQSYPTEAAAAVAHDAVLKKHRADLEKFPVAGGGSLYDWARDFIQAGLQIDALLSRRGEEAAKAVPGGRKDVGKVRSASLGLLSRFRAAVADEVESEPKLPRSLEAQIFAYHDEIMRLRASQGAEAPAPAPPPAPEEK